MALLTLLLKTGSRALSVPVAIGDQQSMGREEAHEPVPAIALRRGCRASDYNCQGHRRVGPVTGVRGDASSNAKAECIQPELRAIGDEIQGPRIPGSCVDAKAAAIMHT